MLSSDNSDNQWKDLIVAKNNGGWEELETFSGTSGWL